MRLPKLAEGSEHLVLFDGVTSEVVKITLPGTYGDFRVVGALLALLPERRGHEEGLS